MYAYIEERVLSVAEYIVEHEATVRSAASKFGISKSTVHHDMQVRLKSIDADLNFSKIHLRPFSALSIKDLAIIDRHQGPCR